MSSNLRQILQLIDEMTSEELRLLYGEILRKLAVPLENPADVFDDWDDPKTDAAYWPSEG